MNNNYMLNTILINEEMLKLYSLMSRNVGIDKVVPFINLSQPIYIEPILGQPLVNELVNQINDNNLTALNKALLIKIAAPLALYTDYLAIRGLAYSITQKGITKEASENSASLNEKELAQFKLDIKNQAEEASELLIKYLCECRDSYPLWAPEDGCLCNDYSTSEGSAKKHFNPNIYFPHKNGGCKNC